METAIGSSGGRSDRFIGPPLGRSGSEATERRIDAGDLALVLHEQLPIRGGEAARVLCAHGDLHPKAQKRVDLRLKERSPLAEGREMRGRCGGRLTPVAVAMGAVFCAHPPKAAINRTLWGTAERRMRSAREGGQ